MAIRKIRTMGDRILNKVCRPVEEMTPKIQELIEDMLETMYDAYGVGLAAPQVPSTVICTGFSSDWMHHLLFW